MPVSDKIAQLYQRFYAQRTVLTEAPTLSIDADAIGAAEFPTDKALAEMAAVAGYLMGLPPKSTPSFAKQVEIVQTAYQDQPFWQQLLLDFLALQLDVRESRLKQEGQTLYNEIDTLMQEVREQEQQAAGIVAHFAKKIDNAGFHVDAAALLRNYFKMAQRGEAEAWQILITNPAYFSPIKAHDDSGKEVLSPAQAVAENARLGHFLKGLKG